MKPRRPLRKWTTAERRTLRDMLRAGKTYAAIGVALGRTRNGTWTQAKAMGLTGTRCAKWTPGQDRIIERELDMLVERLVVRFNRSRGGVRGRLANRLFTVTIRDRARKVTDLGGMRETAIARKDVA